MNKFTENTTIPTSIQSTATSSKHKIHREEFISVNLNADNSDTDGCARKHKRARHTSMAFISCEIDSSPIKTTDDKADCKDECPTLNKVPERNLSLCFESDMYSLLDNHWLSPPSSLQSNKGRSIVQNDQNINEYQFDFRSYSHGDNVMLNINSENNPYISTGTGNDTKIEMCMSNDSNDTNTNSIDSVELQLEFLRTLKKLYKSIQRTDESRTILQRQRFTNQYHHHDEDTYNRHHYHHHRRHYDDEHHYTIQLQQSTNYFTTKEWYETELYRKQFKQIIQNDCLHRTVF